ncbi:DNA-binding transcriptional regulator, FadR family [Devosia crocina]|uniref:DNA-binding transcriptional regulator, FadR family n=1 Tax=Devosia crocina TaxID=429728 RepID=A0A1I7NUW3_9HYPH|nr:GntR family transcriptional regulator [Devosia crocina]SFV38373.1 DNA-binding transcriptional regulator, FadR family [Devosia crocina]
MIEAGSLIRSLSGRHAARNFHTFVINEIGRSIISGSFPVGSVLASDAVMMETYGVSRTVLREALKTLEAKGLVEARPKVGTRVSPKSRWNFFDSQVLAWHYHAPADPTFYNNLFAVRAALERPAAEGAARHRTAEDVRIMKYWLHQAATAGDSVEQFGLACLEVHSQIAESSQNTLLRGVVAVVELLLALALTRHSDTVSEYCEARIGALEQLVRAIEAGHVEGAREHLTASLELDHQRILDGI